MVGKVVYAQYVLAAARLARRLKPDVVYASDRLSAGPGLIAARLAGARLVYHEHDSPPLAAHVSWIERLRRTAARTATVVVLPNEDRARLVGEALGVEDKTVTVWNLPSRRELPLPVCHAGDRLELYYHGSITPDRLPEAVIVALTRLAVRARLRIAGYEAPGARGYLKRLLDLSARSSDGLQTQYLGEIPQRHDLLAQAAQSHVGLAFMPTESNDLNMRHMVGASNKAFDYMAAGLALLVSNLPDWTAAYVAPGYGRACDPADVDALAATFTWFLDHPLEHRTMGARGRARIEADWNYDTAFAPILALLSAA